MGRQVNSNIPEAGFVSRRQFLESGSIAGSDLSIVGDQDNSKRIIFDPSGIATATSVTLAAINNSSNLYLFQSASTAVTSAVFNTSVGSTCLNVLTSGSYNTALGFEVMNHNLVGNYNTGIGYRCNAHVTGNHNTCVGYQAGTLITTGIQNTFVGSNCGAQGSNLTANSNTGVGYSALYNVAGGANNTSFGDSALVGITANNDNTGIGYHAGYTAATSQQCTFLGSGADVATSALNNVIAIGYGVVPTATNAGCIGNATNNIGIGGVVTPTARLHLPAGTATAGTAALKFSTDTLLGTPESGAMEFDGTHLYITISGSRKTITVS